MQQATHPRLHVRDAHDAHVLFEAVRQGFLQPIRRRLNEMERAVHVKSGAIFVWFECEDDAGLKRWTDGRVWGQSRMREPYLFYDEKMPYDSSQSETNRAPAFRFVDGVSRTGPTSSALSHQERSTTHHKGLVKQAYSAWVNVGPYPTRPQKWHLTAYFTYADLPHLPTVDCDELLKKIIVPPNIYKSGKSRGRDDDSESAANNSPSPPVSPSRTMPSLPPLQAAIGHHPGLQQPAQCSHAQVRTHGVRLPEDQRVIQMLNSKYTK
ncbi:hypothetical protein CC1G_01155 [Coprinopsis cinerea okayama7|uniref:cAMP-independent regulatory protein pac2 n=1 Tax=Coprinopsis cinerea (strain Okayama-7 / 130 / ATCC MYA-4618 / FGSC 9003) TaxID=240176 RepID=A8NEQ0_COPC7|nr:hypothetical protein CC1G_01155 [Coprinopsis cinerea okayama7\|eukprot:XP_001833093.1 hypothetical protein CC1G_01155 [Coprinopsis cinerea okayama7\